MGRRDTRGHWGTGIKVAVAIAVAVLGVWSVRQLAAEELPELVKQEKERLESFIQRVAAKVGRFEARAIQVDLKDAEQRLEDFALDAEMFDDDPVMVSLREKVEEIRKKLAGDEQARMAAEAEKRNKQPKISVDALGEIARMTQLPVDLNNVSWKKDVAPIIQNVCVRCHTGANARNGYDVSTYSDFMAHVEKGDPLKSFVWLKVTDQQQEDQGNRMPPGNQTRFDDQWAMIWQKWIQQGAKYDGPANATGKPISEYLISRDEQLKALFARMSTADMEKLHRLHAQRHDQLVRPSSEPFYKESENFIVYSTLPESDLEYVTVLAEAVLEDLREQFAWPADKPVWRGRIGLYVYANMFDYLAFCRDIDNFTPEPGDFGHVTMGPEYPYIVLSTEVPGHDADGIIAQMVSTAFARTLGDKLPDWAAYGFGRSEAMRWTQFLDPYQEDLSQAAQLVSTGRSLMNVFEQKMPWIEAKPMAFAYFRYIDDQAKAKRNQGSPSGAYIKQLAKSGDYKSSTWDAFQAQPDGISQGFNGWVAKHFRRRR